jgi:serine phosphatase RsbU (regulator of sigma subunit)
VISGEIERASRLQRRLLPRPQRLEIPGVDVSIGFEPCRWVGGDYVDVLPTPDGRVFLIVADVSGKGLPAALISSSLHTMVHTGLRAGLGVVRLIDQLNAYLCETLPESSFVTAVAVMLNPATGEVQCVNAGHPPALVVDPDGGHRRLHSAVNLPLGVDLEPMQWQTDQLEPGHLLTLYTDGITETVPDGAKRMLGPDGFAQRLEEIYNYASNATTPLPAGIGEPSGLLGPVLPELDELAQRLSGLLNVLCGSRMAADDRTFLLARRQNTLTSSILD